MIGIKPEEITLCLILKHSKTYEKLAAWILTEPSIASSVFASISELKHSLLVTKEITSVVLGTRKYKKKPLKTRIHLTGRGL